MSVVLHLCLTVTGAVLLVAAGAVWLCWIRQYLRSHGQQPAELWPPLEARRQDRESAEQLASQLGRPPLCLVLYRSFCLVGYTLLVLAVAVLAFG